MTTLDPSGNPHLLLDKVIPSLTLFVKSHIFADFSLKQLQACSTSLDVTFFQILLSVMSLVAEPNINSPANVDAAKLWRDNREEFIKVRNT